MKGMLGVVLFTLLTALCWGVYGPILRFGQEGLGHSGLRAFICVGLAYFVIAILGASVFLRLGADKGSWTTLGTIWSLIAGVAGAVGALGVVLAFKFHGNPLYVTPVIFGLAPAVNTFVAMYFAKSFKQAGPVFFAGLILIVAGAVVVMVFKPQNTSAFPSPSFADWIKIVLSIVMTGLSWGAYGPLLHKGQAAMHGSRLRPIICVGVSYFVIAVIVPGILIAAGTEPGSFSTPAEHAATPETAPAVAATPSEGGGFAMKGVFWSLLGGATGAIGAVSLVMAFNSGGKPIYVMPLVFGLAPVVNTFTALLVQGVARSPHALFYAGLLMVIAGAVTVLVFAPKGHGPPPLERA